MKLGKKLETTDIKPTGYKCTSDGVNFKFSYDKKCRYCVAVYTPIIDQIFIGKD